MTERELRRLMASLVKASGTMGVLIAGGCSTTALDPGTSSAGAGAAGSPHSAGGGGGTAGEVNVSGSAGEVGGTAGSGVMGCAGSECGPAAGTSWCGESGGYGGCGSSGCSGNGGMGGSCSCVEPAPGPCTVPKEVVTTSPFWQGTIPRSCLPDGSALTEADCRALCGFPLCSSSQPVQCSLVEADEDGATVSCRPYVGVGRRPPGLVEAESCVDSGQYLANASMLEAASVVAFRVLERELMALRAPRRLLRRVRRAARDEQRHARATRSLARRFGAKPQPVRTTSTSRRTLVQIALDNATEGCVRETFGALAATYQATMAADREVRSVMNRIAREETSHAALSWQIARWLDARLSLAEREEVAQAMRSATRELRAELETQPSSRPGLGLPSAQVSLDLLRGLQTHLPALSAPE